MLTTIDNPYDPNIDFDKWYMWDLKHYGTCEYLARVAGVTEDMSDEEKDIRTQMAIDEIIDVNVLGVYTLI